MKYEAEVHNQAAALERQRRRGANQVGAFVLFLHCSIFFFFPGGKKKTFAPLNVGCLRPCSVFCTCVYICPQDGSEYMHFLRESHREALDEEERRYRFLAEKHCGLIQSIAQLMNKVHRSVQLVLVSSIFLCDFSGSWTKYHTDQGFYTNFLVFNILNQ